MTASIDPEEIKRWLGGEAPEAARVEELREALPWWLLPAALRLRNSRELGAEERAELGVRLASGASSLEQMSMAADSDLEADLARFYPIERPSTPSTEGTIEKFLNTYGTSDPAEEELLNRLIFNPTPDYAQLLEKEEEASVPKPDEAPEGSPDALINAFIIKSKAADGRFPLASGSEEQPEPPAPKTPVQKPVAEADSTLSESLAHVYIRRGKFAKAYEIISNLNLNFPEKSIYFADQLRFLKKLMAIEERKSLHTDKNNNNQ